MWRRSATLRDQQAFWPAGSWFGKIGSIAKFESNADWRVGGHPSGQEQHAVETSSNGDSPWGNLKQKLGDPAILSDFDAVAKPLVVILLTTVGTMALWLLACRFVATARREPIRYTLARDAVFHAPIIVGLLFLLLPGYNIRFPQSGHSGRHLLDWQF